MPLSTDPATGKITFESDTGETTTATDGLVSSSGYESGSEEAGASVDAGGLLADKDFGGYTEGLLSSGNEALDTGGSDSVSENLTRLLDRNDSFLQSAGADANQAMNKRGLLNSSMAIGAAEDARVRAALPIAQQDAQRVADYNKLRASSYYDQAKTQMGGNIDAYVTQIREEYGLQGLEISNEQAIQLARERMAWETGQTELTHTQQQELAAQEQAWKSGLSAQEAAQATEYMNSEYANRYQLSEQDFYNKLAVDNNLNELQKNYLSTDYAYRKDLMVAQTNEQLRLMNQDAWNKENLALLGQEFAVELANIDGQWKNLFQTNVTASQFYSSIQESISDIMESPDIPADIKDQYIAQQIDALESGLEVIGAIADFDLGSLLNFGNTSVVPG